MRLHLNEFIEVEIIEVLEAGSCIVSIDGSLIRVRSQLDSRPKQGDRLRVKVVALEPLKFQTVRGSNIRLDVEI
jgi:hypothetical protein